MIAPLTTPALRIGPCQVGPPVVLAPMAGITNVALGLVHCVGSTGLYRVDPLTMREAVKLGGRQWRA